MLAENISIAATAASLAMDAFSVSVCVGICSKTVNIKNALVLASAFGGFQFFMPLLGAEIAEHLTAFFDVWTPWLAASLIIWVAFDMIKEAYKNDDGKDTPSRLGMTLKNIIVMAFATSLDALAVGFSIYSTGGSAKFLAVSAGIITFGLTVFGVLGGKKLGEKAGGRACLVGGIVLLLIAAKIVFEALW